MKIILDKKALVAPAKKLVDAGLRGNSFSKSAISKTTGEVVIPYDIPTMEILFTAGLNVKGPINFEYAFKWCKEYPPFDHQKTTADFITKLRRGFIFNDIGTGKTLASLWAFDYLRSLGLANKLLIACTMSTMDSVWSDTLFKSFPQLKFEILSGTKQSRLKKLSRDADVYIVNHDGLKVLCEWRRVDKKPYIEGSVFDERTDIDFVLVDECAVFRNFRTDRTTALMHIAGPQTSRRLWLMSGDPMPNAPTDIWSQAQLVKRGLLHKHFTRFRDKTMKKVTDYKWVPRQGWESFIYESLSRYSVRFMRDECIDLPPRVYIELKCDMDPDQKKAYAEMVGACKALIDSETITAVNEGVKIGKLLQIACGVIYDKNKVSHQFNIDNKLKLLYEAIEQSHHKLIVFAPFTHAVDMLYTQLKKDFKTAIVYGKISKSKRTEIFHNFQHGDLQVLIAQPQTMAHGLDLTSAHTICWWSPMHDYEIFNQANGRITRPGQTHKQTIFKLVNSKIEELVYKKLETKEKMQGLLMQLLTTKV